MNGGVLQLLCRLCVLATLLSASGISQAQTCNQPLGTWQLAPAESSLGSGLSFNPYYAIADVRLTIGIDTNRVSQQWFFKGEHLDRAASYEFVADGVRRATALKDAMDFEYVAVSAEWQNCTLIVQGFSRLFGLEVATTNTYVVSADGRRLTIVQYGESPISVVDRRLVFVRVP